MLYIVYNKKKHVSVLCPKAKPSVIEIEK